MHAISSYRGNKPTNTQTNKHTHKQTHRQDQLQYTAPLSLAHSVMKIDFRDFFTIKFRCEVRSKLKLKPLPYLSNLCHTTLQNLRVQLYNFTAKLIQTKARLPTVNIPVEY